MGRSETIAIKVIPRAGREEIAGEREGAVLVRVTAPTEGGRANVAACRLIARCLSVPTGAVEVIAGHSARSKLVRVAGIDAAGARAKLLET